MNSGPVKAAEKLPKISKSLGLPRTNRSRVPNELVFAVGHFTTLQVFNHRTNRWFTHKKPAFPAKFKEHFFYGAAAVDGKLVAMGKHHAYSLDLSTHIWTKSTELNGTENCPGRATGEKSTALVGQTGTILTTELIAFVPAKMSGHRSSP